MYSSAAKLKTPPANNGAQAKPCSSDFATPYIIYKSTSALHFQPFVSDKGSVKLSIKAAVAKPGAAGQPKKGVGKYDWDNEVKGVVGVTGIEEIAYGSDFALRVIEGREYINREKFDSLASRKVIKKYDKERQEVELVSLFFDPTKAGHQGPKKNLSLIVGPKGISFRFNEIIKEGKQVMITISPADLYAIKNSMNYLLNQHYGWDFAGKN